VKITDGSWLEFSDTGAGGWGLKSPKHFFMIRQNKKTDKLVNRIKHRTPNVHQ